MSATAKSGSGVAVLGASDEATRFANKAHRLLKQHGFKVYPVNPNLGASSEIEKDKVWPDLKSLNESKSPIHTLTLYVRPQISTKLKSEILDLNCQRVIFNPGTENPQLERELRERGREVVEGCTLVMLNAGEF